MIWKSLWWVILEHSKQLSISRGRGVWFKNFGMYPVFWVAPFQSKIIMLEILIRQKINLTHFWRTAPLKTGQNGKKWPIWAGVGKRLYSYAEPPLICRIVDLPCIYNLKFKYGTSFLIFEHKMDQIWLKDTKNYRK